MKSKTQNAQMIYLFITKVQINTLIYHIIYPTLYYSLFPSRVSSSDVPEPDLPQTESKIEIFQNAVCSCSFTKKAAPTLIITHKLE